MAIQKPDQIMTYTLREEIASRVMLLTRTVVDNHDGTISTIYGAVIHPLSITYEVDNGGNKTGIYEDKIMSEFQVPTERLMQLFSTRVTLVDGTVSYIGEVLSNFADQLIAEVIGASKEDVITTQHIDIAAVAPETAPTVEPEAPSQ